jgi:hypothetical protein
VQHEGQHDTVHHHKEDMHEHDVPSHVASDRRGDIEPHISTSISDTLLDFNTSISDTLLDFSTSISDTLLDFNLSSSDNFPDVSAHIIVHISNLAITNHRFLDPFG